MRIIVLTLCFSVCFGGEPPFSSLHRRSSLSPYILMSEVEVPYQMGVRPLIQQERQERAFKEHVLESKQTIYSKDKVQRFEVNRGEIRPTGHKTYFMYIPVGPGY